VSCLEGRLTLRPVPNEEVRPRERLLGRELGAALAPVSVSLTALAGALQFRLEFLDPRLEPLDGPGEILVFDCSRSRSASSSSAFATSASRCSCSVSTFSVRATTRSSLGSVTSAASLRERSDSGSWDRPVRGPDAAAADAVDVSAAAESCESARASFDGASAALVSAGFDDCSDEDRSGDDRSGFASRPPALESETASLLFSDRSRECVAFRATLLPVRTVPRGRPPRSPPRPRLRGRRRTTPLPMSRPRPPHGPRPRRPRRPRKYRSDRVPRPPPRPPRGRDSKRTRRPMSVVDHRCRRRRPQRNPQFRSVLRLSRWTL